MILSEAWKVEAPERQRSGVRGLLPYKNGNLTPKSMLFGARLGALILLHAALYKAVIYSLICNL